MIVRCAILIAAMSVASSAAVAETWSCERPAGREKTERMKWVVSGKQMRAFTPARPSGSNPPHLVVRNDTRALLAVFKKYDRRQEFGSLSYIIIDKKTGALIELYDLAPGGMAYEPGLF
jgi:hypothetical protein